MREQPHYGNLLTAAFFKEYYDDGKKSYPQLREMLLLQGLSISVSTIAKYAWKHGFGRTRSEAKRNRQGINQLDWGKSLLDEHVLEAIDGFILGDGGIGVNESTKSGRLTCGVEYEEFCSYMMRFFSQYAGVWFKCHDASMKQGFRWQGQTYHHPDLYQQYVRWYPINSNDPSRHEKQPPNDVRITPLSVMLWYLGDGSVVQENNAIMLRISTDSFTPERVEFLASKLGEKGIACHRNNDNRIMVEAKGVPAFFNFIGRKSPIRCYDYKFDIPEWRLESKRMRDVAEELGMDYQRLAYLVKIGKVACYRASKKGKPRFMPEHVEALRGMVGVSDPGTLAR